MRNLKKVLALALAMVMALSLMVTGVGATNFSDDGEINGAYREAVEVLTGLKVFKGKNTTDTFAPKDTITRAEVAAIIYRLVTGDVTDKQAGIHADYAKFSDVSSDHWAAGYIGYCSNAELIVGDGQGHFNPDMQINGYQALTMILRAVGYDKNNEFKGSGWEVRVASSSRTLGILKNVSEGMLGQPASREMVAELLFQASLIPTVTYTTALGYNRYNSITAAQVEVNENPSLAWTSFKLHRGVRENIDDWGRPGYKWNSGCTRVTDGDKWKYSGGTTIATIKENYLVRYTKAVKECDAWADAKFNDLGGSKDLTLYLNQNKITEKYNLVATDTTTKVGAQGRITEIYSDRVVMIDTFLAQVTGVTERTLDAGGHVVIPSYLHLTVYDGYGKFNNKETTNAKVTLTNSVSDWTYAVGDMLLVNAKTCPETLANDNRAAHGGQHKLGEAINTAANAPSEEDKNRAAYESEVVKDSRGINIANQPTPGEKLTAGKNVFVKGEATPFTGKQTTVTYLTGTHTMEGKVYNDALELHLNVAANNTSTTYAWYFDDVEQADGSFSLIGIGPMANTTKYGVITAIYAVQNVAGTGTDGTTTAVATVRYADGTTGTETISRILASTQNTGNVAGGKAPANTKLTERGTAVAGTNTDNTVELLPMYNFNTTDPLDVGLRNGNLNTFPNAVAGGWLYLSPAANVNAQFGNAANNDDPYGILTSAKTDVSNLFKFVTTADGVKTAIEVAGATNTANHAGGENTGMYEWLYNSAYNANTVLYKTLNHVALTSATVFVNDSTKFIVRNPGNGVITVYDGVSKLPGNMKLTDNMEVDWVDETGDDVAEVFYATGTFDGTNGWGLLYFNGDADGNYFTHETENAAAWMQDGKYYVRGWLNGEFKEVQIGGNAAVTAETNFNTIKDSVRTTAGVDTYGAHIFAVKMTDGVVNTILYSIANRNSQYLLTANTAEVVGNIAGGTITDGTDAFKVGSSNGNSYYGLVAPNVNIQTGIAYYRVTTNSAYTTGVYAPGTQNSTLSFRGGNAAAGNAGTAADYHFTQDTVKYGDPNNLNWNTYDNQVRVSDVTIVYDEVGGVKTVRELYIDTEQAGSTPGTNLIDASSFVEYTVYSSAGNAVTTNQVLTTGAPTYNQVKIAAANQSWLQVQEVNVSVANAGDFIGLNVYTATHGAFTHVSSVDTDLTRLLNNAVTTATAVPGAPADHMRFYKGQNVYAIAWTADPALGAAQAVILHVTVS